jgi:hypothetical protein
MGLSGDPRMSSREAREGKIFMVVSLWRAKENPLGGGLNSLRQVHEWRLQP